MFYAKLNKAGEVEAYPYTLTDLRFANRNTSFPRDIDEETAASFGLVPVAPTLHKEDPTKVATRTAQLRDDKWIEVWVETPASTKEIADRVAAQAASVRADRWERLRACDWTQLGDAGIDATQRVQWVRYRQDLRDITTQPGFPWDVTWPDSP